MILFIGVAGAGKSVQGRKLSDLIGAPWISTGEILRMHITGEKRRRMLMGELLSDQELQEILEPVLRSNDNTELILDGYPRTQNQAEWLFNFTNRNGQKISCIIHIMAEQSVVRNRLIKRGRPDDNKESIKTRFEEYKRVTRPILKYYEQKGIPVFEIDGNKTQEEVSIDIISKLKNSGIVEIETQG